MTATEARRAEVRAALIGAAEAAIAAHGLPGLRARDLAKTVGCALGAIYTAFPDLDALIQRVNLRTLAAFEGALGPEDRLAPLPDAGAATGELVRIGLAYLDFARANPLRWRALFQHQPQDGAPPPDWYLVEQARLFRFIEAPLRVLRPDLSPAACALLSRTLFSATHGIVILGLDARLMPLSHDVVRQQLETLIRAMAAGLSAADPGDAA
ncbi:TetR-like C-terminal domain-containing protein [Methylobacterium planeticum]|uniref:TetR/AcrR family transcriptional regulator n=1 Tax=Methylobacterium planeticum TaxID=2615211 RepID=A0A6N6N0M3_9HYPH|nr:TetR/AcrR family transcriptional regulator [Methylobacterium planeticum]KAB1075982.1 TetR/AcrR family transcriptional regulator [Methylobacterium planeticum]